LQQYGGNYVPLECPTSRDPSMM